MKVMHTAMQTGGDQLKNSKMVAKVPTTRRTITRPHSTKLFTYNTFTVPNYTDDYCRKPMESNTGNANCIYYEDETKRNIPHPSEGFMVWRLPSRFPPLQDTLAKTAELDPDSLIAGYKIKSTYQEDYTGMQQGELLPLKLVSKRKSAKVIPTKELLSSSQIAYRAPRQSSNFKGNTTRYGCSVGIVRAAHGIVPTLANSKPPLNVSYDTWYSSEFTSSPEKRLESKLSNSTIKLKLPQIDTTSVHPQLTNGKASFGENSEQNVMLSVCHGCRNSKDNGTLRQLFA